MVSAERAKEVIDYVEENGMDAAVARFGCTPSTLARYKRILTGAAACESVATCSLENIEPRDWSLWPRLSGDWIIGSDAHCPYHSTEMVQRLLRTADRLKLGRLLFSGDWMDCEPKSKFDFGGDQFTTAQEMKLTREFIRNLEKYFDEILLLRGNHEERIVKFLKGVRKKFERDPDLAEYASIFVGGNTIEEPWRTYADYFTTDKTMVSNYPVAAVDDKFLVVHPSAYSKLGGKTPADLCGIHLMHVVSTHNHIVGMMPHESGEYYGFDIGGLFDPKKCFYKNMRITRHPQWNQGFGWIKGGRFGQFINHPDLWNANVN